MTHMPVQVKQELLWEENADSPAGLCAADAGKDELAMGPGAMFTDNMHLEEERDCIKEEAGGVEEQGWENRASSYGVSAAAAQAGLYAGHAVKDELVLGPECLQLPDAAFMLHSASDYFTVGGSKEAPSPESSLHSSVISLRDCFVRLERTPVYEALTYSNEQERARLVASSEELNLPLRGLRDCTVRLKRQRSEKSTDSRLEIHNSYECDSCRKTYQKKFHLIRHIRVCCRVKKLPKKTKRNVPDIHSCAVCGEQFVRLRELIKHNRTHTRLRPYSCEICQKKFLAAKKHMTIHTDVKPFSCITCKKKFKRLNDLNQHKLIHEEQKPYSCEICYKKFTVSGNLTKHKTIHSGEKSFRCEICKKVFARSTYLNVHMRIHTGQKPYSCEKCKKEFTQFANLQRHERYHMGIKPYSCKLCDKKFAEAGSLKKHNLVHTDVRLHSCDICKKKFKDQKYVKHHMKAHAGAKRQCNLCKKEVRNLKGHMRIHSHEEKAYSCKICDNKFARSSYLYQHMRVHTAEKLYSCEICKKMFRQKCDLKRHKFIHSGVKPYPCQICGKAFKRASHLKSHMLTHTGVKPYSCGICKKKFTQSGTLKKHKNTMHSESEVRALRN